MSESEFRGAMRALLLVVIAAVAGCGVIGGFAWLMAWIGATYA